MVRNYKKVEIKAIPWAHVLKVIRSTDRRGISIYQLAEELDVDRGDERLEKALEQLHSQGRIIFLTGAYQGMVCRFVQASDLVTERHSKRNPPPEEVEDVS